MNDDITARIARRAAGRLAGTFGPNNGDEVERELNKDPLASHPERALDPVSVAALIVSLVSFGWTVYRDIKKDREAAKKADRAEMERSVAARLREEPRIASGRVPSGWTEEQQAIVIEALAVEIVAAAPPET